MTVTAITISLSGIIQGGKIWIVTVRKPKRWSLNLMIANGWIRNSSFTCRGWKVADYARLIWGLTQCMPDEVCLPPSSNIPICRYDSPDERTSPPRSADTLTTTPSHRRTPQKSRKKLPQNVPHTAQSLASSIAQFLLMVLKIRNVVAITTYMYAPKKKPLDKAGKRCKNDPKTNATKSLNNTTKYVTNRACHSIICNIYIYIYI